MYKMPLVLLEYGTVIHECKEGFARGLFAGGERPLTSADVVPFLMHFILETTLLLSY